MYNHTVLNTTTPICIISLGWWLPLCCSAHSTLYILRGSIVPCRGWSTGHLLPFTVSVLSQRPQYGVHTVSCRLHPLSIRSQTQVRSCNKFVLVALAVAETKLSKIVVAISLYLFLTILPLSIVHRHTYIHTCISPEYKSFLKFFLSQ